MVKKEAMLNINRKKLMDYYEEMTSNLHIKNNKETLIVAKKVKCMIDKIEKKIRTDNELIILHDTLSILINIFDESNIIEAKKIIDEIFERDEEDLKKINEADFFYKKANYEGSNIKNFSCHDLNYDVDSFNKTIEVKNLYWKAIQACVKSNINTPASYLINLGQNLGLHCRFIESLSYFDSFLYDKKNNENGDEIIKALFHKSENLKKIDMNFGHSTPLLIKYIKNGYEYSLNDSYYTSDEMHEYCRGQIKYIEENYPICNESDFIDHIETLIEYKKMSRENQFFLKKNLSISFHGLYCRCKESLKDDLIIDDNHFQSLSEIKTKFIYIRKMYFEAETNEDYKKEKYEIIFKECFSILDTIANYICATFTFLKQEDKKIYFESFWKLNEGNKMKKFLSLKNNGLLALYSVATDLNKNKNGEFGFLKEKRNSLTHNFINTNIKLKSCDVEKIISITRACIFYLLMALKTA